MSSAHVIISILLAVTLFWASTVDFVRDEGILIAMKKLGVPTSWLPVLGILKTAAGFGLLVGLRVPLIGTAAKIGLIVFFVSAIVTHLRAHDTAVGPAVVFLLMAAATLALGLASSSEIGLSAWLETMTRALP